RAIKLYLPYSLSYIRGREPDCNVYVFPALDRERHIRGRQSGESSSFHSNGVDVQVRLANIEDRDDPIRRRAETDVPEVSGHAIDLYSRRGGYIIDLKAQIIVADVIV